MTQDSPDQEARQWRAAWLMLCVAVPLLGIALLVGSVVQLTMSDRDHDELRASGQAMPGTVGPQLPVAAREWNRISVAYTSEGQQRTVETLCPLLAGCPAAGTTVTLWFDSSDPDHWTSDLGQGSDSEAVRRSQVIMPILGVGFVLALLPGIIGLRRQSRRSQRQAQVSAERVERLRAERMRRKKRSR